MGVASVAAMTLYRELVPVYSGSLSEVIALQAALGSLGFETIIEDEAMKTIDPFITGACGLTTTLSAPATHAVATQAALRILRSDPPLPRPAAPGEPEEALEAVLAATSRRIRFACMAGLLAPVGLLLGVKYMALSSELETRPHHHTFTVAAIALCAVETVVLAAATASSMR
jgi:hypothetical protein